MATSVADVTGVSTTAVAIWLVNASNFNLVAAFLNSFRRRYFSRALSGLSKSIALDATVLPRRSFCKNLDLGLTDNLSVIPSMGVSDLARYTSSS